MTNQLEALEVGILTEEQRDLLSHKTDDLMTTMKLKVQQVGFPHRFTTEIVKSSQETTIWLAMAEAYSPLGS